MPLSYKSFNIHYDVIDRYPNKYEVYERIRFYLRTYKYYGELTTSQYRTLLGHAKRISDKQNYRNIKNWFVKRNHFKDWLDILRYRDTKAKYLDTKIKVTLPNIVREEVIDIDIK